MKWQLDSFKQKDIVFIGKGREGLSFETFIKKHGSPASFTFVDQNDGPDYLDNLTQFDRTNTIFVKTAGCPGHLVPVPFTTPTNVFFELARQAQYTLIGITGTKGKSTTASLVHHILTNNGIDATLCGNIGLPMIDFLDKPPKSGVYVVELGAYMTTDLHDSPHIAVIGNLYREHIDYFGDEATYYEAKHNLIKYQSSKDYYIYNPDFALLQKWAESAESINKPIEPSKADAISLIGTKLIGDHNKLNILLAIEVAEICNISKEAALQAIKTFKPLPHRLEHVANVNGITYVDDAISTTPESTLAALSAINSVGCLLLGGLDRGYNFSVLAKTIAALDIPNIVLFPDSGEQIASQFPSQYHPNILRTTSMRDAVAFAANNTLPGSTVLLSCASPSYSIWKDFEAKGNDFKQHVLNLK